MQRSKAKAGVMQRYFGDDAFVAAIQGKAPKEFTSNSR
jgi:hypothetical protein